MKTVAQDVFTALYGAFRKLDTITGPEEPEEDAALVAIEVYRERMKKAQLEVQGVLDAGAKILDRYVENRVKKVIAKMKYDGELK
jgi:hypothetical protein